MEGSGMKPGSGKDSTYVLEVDKWKGSVRPRLT